MERKDIMIILIIMIIMIISVVIIILSAVSKDKVPAETEPKTKIIPPIEVDIMQMIADHFGLDKELIQAINKYFRASTQIKWTEAYDSVVEEIADVQIMLEQMRIVFGDKSVDEQITAKLGRLEKRLKGGAE